MAWLATKAGRPGRPSVFSDAAIQCCLMVKVLFGLPLRQTTGMVTSIVKLAGLDWRVPDFSTLSRRQRTLTVQIPFRRHAGPLSLLVDSTEIKLLGDGKWLSRKHGAHRRRQYRKVHLAMDTATGDIRAVEFTSSDKGDSPILPHLLERVPPDEQVGTVTGDGAFDTRRCHTVIHEHGGAAVIPIRKNGRLWKEDCPAAKARNEIFGATQCLGRAIWKRWSGYHIRSRIEASMPSQVHSNLWRSPARPQSFRRTHRLKRPRPPNRRNPYPHRTYELLQCIRHRRDRAPVLNSAG